MIAKILSDDLTYAQVNSENPNICFLHGWGGESNDWKNISKEFDCIAIDIPGFGKSVPFELSGSPEFYSEYLVELIPDSVEVIVGHSFGGVIAVQQVLSRVLEQPGVRLAQPGEFSQRAVLNGRLDLTRAEAIADLVGARSQRAAQLAMAGLDGGIQKKMGALRERLLDQLSELEARVDFEEDLPPLDGEALLQELQAVRSQLL